MINDNQRLSPVALVMFLNLLVILLDINIRSFLFTINFLRERRSKPHITHTPPQ
jgi:hypothetical protein